MTLSSRVNHILWYERLRGRANALNHHRDKQKMMGYYFLQEMIHPSCRVPLTAGIEIFCCFFFF